MLEIIIIVFDDNNILLAVGFRLPNKFHSIRTKNDAVQNQYYSMHKAIEHNIWDNPVS